MAPKLSHPFLEGLKDVPEGKKKDLQKIKSWMNTQAHLPPISDEYIYLFLHACYYSQEKTKSAIESYFTIRANHPAIFGERDPYCPRMQTVLDMGYSKSTPRIVDLSSKDPQRDHAGSGHDIPARARRRVTSLDSLNPRIFGGSVTRVPHQGGLVSRIFVRYMNNYQLHPEKLKQIMKERDGQQLCNYYDSDMYKRKAVDVVEEQNRVITEGAPKNLNPSDVTYEHMLSCAQPRQKPKIFVMKKKKRNDDAASKDLSYTSKTKKSTAMQKMIDKTKKKKDGEIGLPVNEAQIVYSHDPSVKKEGMNIMDCRKKYRKRTTILPLYVKKIQETMALNEKLNTESSSKTLDASSLNYDEDTDKVNREQIQSKKPVYVIKGILASEEVSKKDDDKKPRERLFNVDYETEVLNLHRFKPKSKYSPGSEVNRHWFQSAFKKSPETNDVNKDVNEK